MRIYLLQSELDILQCCIYVLENGGGKKPCGFWMLEVLEPNASDFGSVTILDYDLHPHSSRIKLEFQQKTIRTNQIHWQITTAL